MAIARWRKALTVWSQAPATQASQERALECAWRQIREDFGLETLPSVKLVVAVLPARSRVRVGADVVEIAEHLVLESWSATLCALLYAAVLCVAGTKGDRGRGSGFCIIANRIGQRIGAVYVRPRAHGNASPALWPMPVPPPRAGRAQPRERDTAKIPAQTARSDVQLQYI